MSSALMAFFHHLAAFALTGSIMYELVAFHKDLTVAEARRIQRMDIVYGVSAAIVLIVGLLRVFNYEKGAPFYAHNLFFWTKMAGFALVGLLSVYPTIRFLSWIKPLARHEPPQMTEQEVSRIKLILRLEMAGIAVILLSAALMARGLGML
jgi:putative membrane protein